MNRKRTWNSKLNKQVKNQAGESLLACDRFQSGFIYKNKTNRSFPYKTKNIFEHKQGCINK